MRGRCVETLLKKNETSEPTDRIRSSHIFPHIFLATKHDTQQHINTHLRMTKMAVDFNLKKTASLIKYS
jgi:hypothetical protein